MVGIVRHIFARGDSAAASSGPAVNAAAQTKALRRLWWAAVLLLGLSASAVAWTVWQLRNDAIDAAAAESGNIASVLAYQLSRSLQGIDVVLLEVKQTVEERNI